MKNITKVLVVLLCLVLVAFSVISCGKDPKDTTAPDTTPEVTTPEDTEPETTEPKVTEPEVTTPEETLPDETLPDETLPSETEPEGTVPAETTPAETKPADTTTPAEPHKHVHAAITTSPTCESDGTVTYICVCGDSYVKPGEPARGHAWKYVSTQEPTCLVEGYETYVCVSCGETENRSLGFAPHTFTVSTQLVAAADEPLGKGYEILACAVEGCNYLSKVVGNHESGHHFKLVEGTAYACACGQTAQQKTENIGLVDFEAADSAKAISFGGLNATNLVDGKVIASLYTGQGGAMGATTQIREALGGKLNGVTIDTFRLSWEYSYTGDPENIQGGALNWRYNDGSPYKEFTINVSRSGGKLTVDGKPLEPETVYTLALEFSPSKDTVELTIVGGEYAERTVISTKNPPMEMNQFTSFMMTRSALYCADTSAFALYMDNLSADVILLVSDEGAEVNQKLCEHVFGEPKSIIDVTHPTDEMWLRQTCEKCGGFFESRNCEGLGYHTWLPNPIAEKTVASTCTDKGTEYYECLYCDAIDVRRLNVLGHDWSKTAIAEKTIAATCDQTGVEYYPCTRCDELNVKKVNATGHKWVEETVIEHTCLKLGKVKKTCTVCGKVEYKDVLPTHNYLVFEGVVSKADDSRAIGYEMWSCPDCGQIAMIDANHVSGHFFDGSGKCACGAKTTEERTNVGTAVTSKIISAMAVEQEGLYVGADAATAIYKEVLGGSYNGEKVDFAALSMLLYWEGDTASCNNKLGNRGDYIMWRFNDGAEAVNVGIDVSGEEPKLYYGSKEFTLKEGVKHELRFYADLASQTVSVQVTPEDGETVVLGSQTVTLLDKTWRMYVNGGRYGDCANTELYAMHMENLHLDVIELLPDESGMTTVECEHEFVESVSDDAQHPGIYGWMKYTCECGQFFFRLVCEEAGHTWAVEPDATKTVAPSCFAIGYEYYPCAYCDAEDVRELEMIEHVFATEPDAARTEPAKCEQTGMEYYPCTYEGCMAYDEKVLEALEHNWVEVERTQNDCTQEGLITYECLNACGTPKTETLPMEHVYIDFGGVVSKADDPRGVGYELWSCPGCLEAKKIAGNHESGHTFTDGKCACGAFLAEVATLAGSSFTDEVASSKYSADGQVAYSVGDYGAKVPIFNEVLGGSYNGAEVSRARMSVDLRWTGDTSLATNTRGKNGIYFSWRFNNNSYDSNRIEVCIDVSGEKVRLYYGSNEAILEKNETYTLAFDCDIETNVITIKVIDSNGEATLLGERANNTVAVGTSSSMYINGGRYGDCADESKFAIYLANLGVSVLEFEPNESEMVEPICAHAFDYAAEGEIATRTCTVCGVFYTEESCEALDHVWADEAYTSEVTCQGGTETYKCLVCGADDVRDVEPGAHVYTVYVSTTAAEGDVAGYETWQCTWCDETENREANHASGHHFTDNLCACGAKAVQKTVNVATNDFSNTTGAVSFGNQTTLSDGVIKISKLNSQGIAFSKSNNSKFANIYTTGLAEDGTAVDKLILSFDIKWTGNNLDFTNGKGKTFTSGTFNWRASPGANGASYKDEFTLGFAKRNGGLEMNLSGTNYTALTKGQTYRLAFEIDLVAKTIQVYLDGVAYSNPITPVVFDNFSTFYISRGEFYTTNEDDFLFVMDNASIDYVYTAVDAAE